MIVIDSNIFAKIFVDEPDAGQAKAFFKHCIQHDVSLLAPTLFTYEVLQIAAYYQYPLADALQSIEDYCVLNLRLVNLEKNHWLAVEKIIKSGHEKSGFPAVYDSSYHALAQVSNGVFLTADKRHEAKTRQFGYITLLKDWKSLFKIYT